ncbi:unnamed protein product [Nezara viridula]|uniref:Neuropeptide n=1 Tax=Nezara viridula TaxID=85310 RepID=A0A9P0MRS2_NEZVI|nr:unnamed protein product [Nezara viridula]
MIVAVLVPVLASTVTATLFQPYYLFAWQPSDLGHICRLRYKADGTVIAASVHQLCSSEQQSYSNGLHQSHSEETMFSKLHFIPVLFRLVNRLRRGHACYSRGHQAEEAGPTRRSLRLLPVGLPSRLL